MPSDIFVSYRRGADEAEAGWLVDRLKRKFGPTRVFKDTDSIPLGADFKAHIEETIGRVRVFLVVIGSGWLSSAPRLQDPDDFVRLEIEAALARSDVKVIPVVLGGVEIPAEEALPASIRALTSANAFIVPQNHFEVVVDGSLLPKIEALVDRRWRPSSRHVAAGLGAVLLGGAALGAGMLLSGGGAAYASLAGLWQCEGREDTQAGTLSYNFEARLDADGTYSTYGARRVQSFLGVREEGFRESGTFNLRGDMATLNPTRRWPESEMGRYVLEITTLSDNQFTAVNQTWNESYQCERNTR